MEHLPSSNVNELATENESDRAKQFVYTDKRRLWTANEFPKVASWLALNERAMQLVYESSKRPRFYEPLIVTSSLYEGSMSHPAELRRVAQAFSLRAMLNAAKDDIRAASDDLMAVHRLARAVGQQPMMINVLLSLEFDDQACRAEQSLLSKRNLSASDWLKLKRNVEDLPSLPTMLETFETTERFAFLDTAALVARNGFDEFRRIVGGGQPLSDNQKNMFAGLSAMTDWDRVLRNGNSWYDRLADAVRKPTHKERIDAIAKVAAEFDELKTTHKKKYAHDLLRSPREATSDLVCNIFLLVVFPPTTIAEDPWARSEMRLELITLGFAMAAYRADHGSYPSKLAELSPKYITAIPKDLFADGELHYKLNADGYVIYSVGPNGVDDGGKGMDEAKNGESWDDIALRIPGPTNAREKQ
jgi:hypothetical protein